MDTAKLLGELVKSNDSLQDISVNIAGQEFSFYFKYLTILEKLRIKQMCVKSVTTINADGSKTVKHEENEELYPVYLILEKALNEDGSKMFSMTSKDDYATVAGLPAGVASTIAYYMSLDVFGNMEVAQDE